MNPINFLTNIDIGNMAAAYRRQVITTGLFTLLISILVSILIIRAIIKYAVKEMAKEIRKNNGEQARAIAYELKQIIDQKREETKETTSDPNT